jgi:hypothetical protein
MRVAVYGASGHTGRFVVAELLRRGHTAIAIGRDERRLRERLEELGDRVSVRGAALDDSAALDRALAVADAVINCAGPFLDTAAPLVEAALRAGIHYLDVTAEQASAQQTLDAFDAPARERGVCVIPAAGFFGGLGDVLATAAMSDWDAADRIDIAIALDRWWPTVGTRETGKRNTATRLVLRHGSLRPIEASLPFVWEFAQPFGSQDVVEVPFTETILIARHLDVRDLRSVLASAPLRDLRDPATPGPVAVDAYGRSDQQFLVEIVVHRGGATRRASFAGRDIYAVTAPIVVEALETIGSRAGAFALGQIVDAPAFVAALRRAQDDTGLAAGDGADDEEGVIGGADARR